MHLLHHSMYSDNSTNTTALHVAAVICIIVYASYNSWRFMLSIQRRRGGYPF